LYDYKKKIEAVRKNYIKMNGMNKYNGLVSNVKSSKYLRRAIDSSMNNNHPLGAGDFLNIIDRIFWYVAGPSKAIMGQ
jgi:SLT domain-containing protein